MRRPLLGQDGLVLIVRATQKLLRLAGPPEASDQERGTTVLGPWYATVLFWRPRLALLVNESTLLPLLLPLAPALTLTSRIPEEIAATLITHGVPTELVDQEREHMRTCQLGKTADRSVVGVMTYFARLAEIHHDTDPAIDPAALAIRLARTPCGPLYDRNIRPDHELAATVRALAQPR
jgi:hypothetical protein